MSTKMAVVMMSRVPGQYRIGSYRAGTLNETMLKTSMIEEPSRKHLYSKDAKCVSSMLMFLRCTYGSVKHVVILGNIS